MQFEKESLLKVSDFVHFALEYIVQVKNEKIMHINEVRMTEISILNMTYILIVKL